MRSRSAQFEGVSCRICAIGNVVPRPVTVSDRQYWQCERCGGTFATLESLPSHELEQEQYNLHENDPADPNYRRFVAHLVDPLITRLPEGAEGLDYGCGDGPAGAALLTEAGFVVRCYDPFFANDISALERQYDFIFCCEVVEHFHNPARDFHKLDGLLKPGGILAVMTAMEYPDLNFDTWHYRRDPTHVAFYRPDTMLQIGWDHDWQTVLPARNVALFTKRS